MFWTEPINAPFFRIEPVKIHTVFSLLLDLFLAP